ncbi:putative xylulokinase [Microsporum canis]|uniref:Probable D-xylulose kinase A n=1 Tax=Arthroderma otae (strain ATCC MYA-4605 / CBS 113480) TaxID=554155 RepID=XKS1_ARTOC|nr:D-xylulose kinase [Microsporum canis CBS 113480]C5FSW4.1 RecName: Full=Probable D-xylulose kinase A; Short=Xylulokinase A [Microsporum canis CBS 113480]EEQ32967.1 D-xylulose kinase [Microsporum canis CBS 113480]
MGSSGGPLYIGFDLSTQQLKGLVVSSDLKVVHIAKFDFDSDSKGFNISKGVLTNEDEGEVFAPVAMWLQALDAVLQDLKHQGLDFSLVRGISGAGQQHGSVYWNESAEEILGGLDGGKTLEDQLQQALSYPYSPNWQDSSTQRECDEFDAFLGSEEELARVTGSKAHHILRFQRKHPDAYRKTSRISLVSSFLASIFLGSVAPFDISDVCGMNLWDMPMNRWNERLLKLCAGEAGPEELKKKLGDVPHDGGQELGKISSYFAKRYSFHPDCAITPSTGDNPATILALPLRPLDAMVSLGTSTTFLMSTPQYKPDPSTHFFNHPTTPGLYMFMLCYKNGGLAREQVRDAINATSGEKTDPSNPWSNFDRVLLETPPGGQKAGSGPMKMGLFFPRPEIVPNLGEGEWHFNYTPGQANEELKETDEGWTHPRDDARAIVESQFLSLRLRSKELVHSPSGGVPPQPRRIYLVGGGSRNAAIAKVAGEVLGGIEGVYKLDVGENACALGAAYKAVWALERAPDQTFEDLIGRRWREDEFVEKIADGFQPDIFEKYRQAVQGFEKMEKQVLMEAKQ